MSTLRERSVLVLLAALTAFGPMSIDMYLPGLPALAKDLGGSGAGAELTLSAFFVGFGGGQLLFGPLSDRYGRRAPLLAGLAVFTLASAGCAFARSIEELILWRFLQALGGCAGPVLARAMVRDLYEREQAARALSLMMVIMGLAPLIAPVLGSQILLVAGWRTIFWALGLFAVLCAAGALAILPETLPSQRRRRGSFFAMLRSYVEPATSRAYLAYAFSGALIFAGLFAYIAGSPFVFITYFGLEPQHYALLFGANALGIMAMSATNGRLVPRIGVDRMLAIGIGLAAVAGTLLLVSALVGRGGAIAVIVPLFFFVCSIGLVGANAMAGGLALFPDRAGVASALAGTLQFLTGAVGASLVSVFSNGTPLPMAAVIAGAGILSLVARRTL